MVVLDPSVRQSPLRIEVAKTELRVLPAPSEYLTCLRDCGQGLEAAQNESKDVGEGGYAVRSAVPRV